MSFLIRRPSWPGNRASDAGHDEQHDDLDYAPDGYARGGEDENWSANEYFSPEGIKGRRAAGHQPGEHPSDRRQRDPGQRDPGGPGYDVGRSGFRAGPGPDRPGSGAAENYGGGGHQGDGYGTGEYGTASCELPDGADEERGGRKRKDLGERVASRLRLRRDRGEDIWPDDDVSDEDYWASVAADRPLTPANTPLHAGPLAPGGGSRQPAQPGDPRLAEDQRARPVSDSRSGGAPPEGTGRLGPAPGLVGSAQARGATGQAQANSGGPPKSEGAQPSFRPSGSSAAGGPDSARSDSARSDRGERTERIDRVTASGYPDPLRAGRSQGHADAPAPSGSGSGGGPGAGRAGNGTRRAADRRETGREPGRSSGYGPARAAGDEDPLTSDAYSRYSLGDADGRSYRVAARRSQAQAKLTEETQTFAAPSAYPADRYPTGQYPTGERPGGGQQRSHAQEQTSRYPAYGSQQPVPQPGQHGQSARQGQAAGQPGQPDQGPRPVKAAHLGGNSGRVSLPGTPHGPTGPYQPQQAPQPQQARQPPQRPQVQQPRQPAQQALPAGGNPYESGATASYPYQGQGGSQGHGAQAGYPSRQAPPAGPAEPGLDDRDDRRRRQAPPDGYRAGGPGQGHQGRGPGAGYDASRDGRSRPPGA